MSMPHLFAASLILTACAIPTMAQSKTTPTIADAAASTPAPSQDHVNHVPAMTQSRDADGIKTSSPRDIQTAIALNGLKVLESKVQIHGKLALNEGTCYTMRASKFTDEDLASSAPRASSYTTCTPASGIRMKYAEAVPAK